MAIPVNLRYCTKFSGIENMQNNIIFLILLLLADPGSQWNSDFTAGKINRGTIVKKIPTGSDYDDLLLYIKKNKIPKYSKSQKYGYSEKVYSKEFVFYVETAVENKISYFIELHGHVDYGEPLRYYHPVLYLCFDKNDKLIYVGEHGYP